MSVVRLGSYGSHRSSLSLLIARNSLLTERELYELGPRLLTLGSPLPDLPADELAHVLRGMWDSAGFIGPNNGGYPVASLVAPLPTARGVAAAIERVTGRRSAARPLHGAHWVGVSGRACAPWLRYLYDGATARSELKLRQALALIELADSPASPSRILAHPSERA